MATGRNKYILDLQENVRELQRNHNELTNIVLKAVMDLKKLMESTGTTPATMTAPSAMPMPTRSVAPKTPVAASVREAAGPTLLEQQYQQQIEQSRKIQMQQAEQMRELQRQLFEQQTASAAASSANARPIMASVAKAPKKGRKPRRKVVVESEEDVAADDAATEADE